MALFLAPIINGQQQDSNGDPLNAGMIEIYLAGSSTAVASYSDQAGAIPNTWPVVLNTLGLNSQGAIWLPGGTAYKFMIKDMFGVTQRTIDNVSGINDASVAVDQWVLFAGPPTYISAASFSVVGDQTPTLQVGRRLQTVNTSGTLYSTITASAYSAPNTTVTVQNDSTVLDAGLSTVSYGLISPVDSSMPPGRLIAVRVLSSSGTYNRTPGATSGWLRAVGGGAGGGSTTATAAGQVSVGAGGQCGAYAEHFFNGNLPASQAYTIGAGGGSGAAGGATVFGALSAPGGNATSVAPAGTPPVLIGGNATISTATGFNILNSRTGPGGSGLAVGGAGFVSGGGANSPFGPGAAPNVSGSAVGTTALNPGAGGAGASAGASTGALGGGGGAAGLILLYEYA